MKYPSKAKLEPLARKHIDDTGLRVLASGKITNGKKGLNRFEMMSVHKYGILLYQNGFIERKGGKYRFKPMIWGGFTYPFKKPLDLRHTLPEGK